MRCRRLLLLFVLFTTSIVGYAQATVTLTESGDGTWTLAAMPDYNVKMQVEYYNLHETLNFTKNGNGTWSINAMPEYDVKMVVEYEDVFSNIIDLTDNGNGTWTLASMPDYNVKMMVEYEDDDQFLTGRFSVAADKQVTFSPGNLQYKASTSTWAFAENQYDFVGGDNTNISSTYDGWIDLFGWGTSGYNDKQPYMTSDTDYDYGDGTNDLTGTNYDWGAYASISNGGNMDWRTLSASEWDYLLQTRDDAASKHGNATVAGIKGLVLLPDKWQLPEGLSFTADPTDWTTNTYNATQWEEMEAAGAVFLPASGRRINGGTIYNFATNCRGYYWTVSASGEDRASFLDFREAQAAKNSTDYRSMGFAVRLASDVVIKTVSNPTVTLEKTYYFYDGTAKTPTVTVMDGSTVIPASEYTVGYKDNVNVGTATVTITDNEDGDYIVSGSATFEIGLKGDANGDNKVDAADIVEMVNETKGQPSVKFKKNNADIDGNGQITDADITEVAKIILAK